MTCPEIPIWFIWLATWGAVSGVTFICFGLLAWLTWRPFNKDEKPARHTGEIKRRLFG